MEEIEKHYKKEAEEFVDMLFDNGYFAKELTRKDMRKLEDYVGFIIQSKVKSALRANELLRKVRAL